MKRPRYRRGPYEEIWIEYEAKRAYRAPLTPYVLAPIDVAAVRRKLGLSQPRFAHCFGIPVATLRHWEQGNRKPQGCALALLHVIDNNAAVATRAIFRAKRRFTP